MTGVNVVAGDGDDRCVGTEGFVFHLTQIRAIHGVGVLRAEASQVETLGAAPDFFVRREGNPQFPVPAAPGAAPATPAWS